MEGRSWTLPSMEQEAVWTRSSGEEWVRSESALHAGRWPELTMGGMVGGRGKKKVDTVGRGGRLLARQVPSRG